MKKVKNVAFVLTIAGIFLSLCMVLYPLKEVKADNLRQSDDQISKEVKHSHGDEMCHERVWVPCGGTWSAYFEPYHMCTCYSCSNWNSDELSNGVPLKMIHGAFVTSHEEGTHDGSYYSKVICEYNQVGDLTITKVTNGDRVTLQASFDNRADIVGDYSISWNGCQTYSQGDAYATDISHNGIYTASLNWYDTKTDTWCQESLSYTDTSIPIKMNFYDGDTLIGSREVSYGGELPEPPAFTKKGYNLTSYTYNGQNIYTGDLTPVSSVSTNWETESVDIYATYSPKEYLIYYGEDVDQDGLPDKQARVTYGEAYEPLELEEGEVGSITGFGLDGINFYDQEGNPNYESWMWDIEDGAALVTNHVKSQSHDDDDSDDNNDDKELNVNIAKQENIEIKTDVVEEIEDNIIEEAQTPKIKEKESKVKEKENKQDKIKEDLTYQNQERVITYIPETSPNPTSNPSDAKLSSNSEVKTQMDKEAVVKSKKAKSPRQELIEQAVKISCAVIGGAMALYGLVWYWLYLYSSVGIYSYTRDGKRKLLSRVIVYKKGNIFICKIRDKIVDMSQSYIYEVEFLPDFLKRNRNKDIILCFGRVGRGGTRISEVIMPSLKVNLINQPL